MAKNVLAFDLGASGGRLMLGAYDGKGIKLTEVHRFENRPVRMSDTLYWNTFMIFDEMKTALKKAAAMLAGTGERIDGIGIDTWGVDYGLLDGDGNIIGMPIHYRDERTKGYIGSTEPLMKKEELYKRTGIQFMDFNTVYQLRADQVMRPRVMEAAKHCLFMPDLFGYLLCGEVFNEYTIMSTGALINASTRKPDPDIFNAFGIPMELFKEPTKPGTIIGRLTKAVCEETGLSDIPFIAVGSHDTASAVAGTPLSSQNAAYISCGTWSLLGMELAEPVINDESFGFNFTNEGGVGETIRFLKNINGLWIIQQLRRDINASLAAKQSEVTKVSFGDIIEAAQNAKQVGHGDFCIDPSDPVFMAPPNMADAVRDYCISHGQGTPKDGLEGLGELAIAVYNGLANEYKLQTRSMEQVLGRTADCIHMVGGGIQDTLLCKMTAEVTGKQIKTGPIEASVMGNVLMQLLALGEIKSVEEGRAIISR